MKTPIMLGLTALCVLSTPAIIHELSYSNTKGISRTIASSSKIILKDRATDFDKGSPEVFIDGIKKDLQIIIKKRDITLKKLESKNNLVFEEEKNSLQEDIGYVIESLDSLKEQVEKVEKDHENNESDDLSEVKDKISKNLESSMELEKKINNIDTSVRDVTSCEFENEIDQLKNELNALLEDKSKVIAKVSKESNSDKEDEEKSVKKPKRQDTSYSSIELLNAMNVLFGHAASMPQYQFQSLNSFSSQIPNYSPMMSFNQSNHSLFNLMRRPSMPQTNAMNLPSIPGIGHRTSFRDPNFKSGPFGMNDFAPDRLGEQQQAFIPKFGRNAIEAETYSF